MLMDYLKKLKFVLVLDRYITRIEVFYNELNRLLWHRYNTRAALLIDRHVRERRFGDFHAFFFFRIALRINLDIDRD